ncbi:MAG TPA: hypothetical protein DEP84_17155 [Chloroflexi bacterium]|nr:hypothetical protein [Chloroflexota bacterium]
MTGRTDKARLSLLVSMLVGALLLAVGWFTQPRAWATSSLPTCSSSTIPGPGESACLFIPVIKKAPLQP